MLDPDPRWLTHSYGHTPEDSIEVPSTRRRNRSPSPPPRDRSPSPLRRVASPLRRAKVRRPSRQDDAPPASPRRSMPRPPTGSRPSHDARNRRRGALLEESTETGATPSTPSRDPARTPTAKGRRGSRTYDDDGESTASASGTSSPATSPHVHRRRRSHTRNGRDTAGADGSHGHSHALHEAPATAATAIEIEAAGARVKRHINNASSHSQDSDLHRAKDLCETLGRKTGKALAAMRDIFHRLEVAVPKHLIHALNAIDSADTLSGADAKVCVCGCRAGWEAENCSTHLPLWPPDARATPFHRRLLPLDFRMSSRFLARAPRRRAPWPLLCLRYSVAWMTTSPVKQVDTRQSTTSSRRHKRG